MSYHSFGIHKILETCKWKLLDLSDFQSFLQLVRVLTVNKYWATTGIAVGGIASDRRTKSHCI